MSIVISTPTGNVGSKVVARLLDARADITVMARNPAKVEALAKRGVKVAAGSLDDLAFVAKATRGAQALFWVTPPNMAAADFRAYQQNMGRIAAEAVRANGIPRVLHLSSVGAHRGRGTGPVNGLHDVEKAIDAVATNVTHLRPAFFMENFLWQLQTIKTAGQIYMPIAGSARLPMIATADIAEAAARLLLDLSWTGRRVKELHGPADISFDEAAATLSKLLEKPVTHVTVPGGMARDAMIKQGLSPNVADLFLELYQGIENGLMAPEQPRSVETTTKTTFEQFVREVLRPALL